MAGPEQRNPIFPSLLVSAPKDYPPPKSGRATRLSLTTPDKTPVGTLVYNDGGLTWTPESTEDVDAQEYAAELLAYIRGHCDQGADAADVVDGIRDAYTGDLTEDQVRLLPSGKAK